MRDLDRYPLTMDECIDAVTRAAKEHAEKARLAENVVFGDIHGIALVEAANRLRRLQFAANGV